MREQDESAPSGEVFRFRYPPHENVRRIGIGLVVVLVGSAAISLSEGDGVAIPVLVVAGVAVGTWFLYVGMRRVKPDMPDLKWLSVSTGRGLEVGRLRLPADRVGEVVEIDRRTATDAMHTPRTLTLLRCRIGERETAPWRVIFPIWHEHAALWVEDLEAADPQRRWWLLAVPEHVDQSEFAAALRSVRAGGAGGDERDDSRHADERPEGPGSGDATRTEDP